MIFKKHPKKRLGMVRDNPEALKFENKAVYADVVRNIIAEHECRL